MSADDFPTGSALDRLVLWAVGEMRRLSPDTEAWSSTVGFYVLRECGMTDFANELHYQRLVDRSLERLRVAGLLTINADEGQGWRPREMEAL